MYPRFTLEPVHSNQQPLGWAVYDWHPKYGLYGHIIGFYPAGHRARAEQVCDILNQKKEGAA